MVPNRIVSSSIDSSSVGAHPRRKLRFASILICVGSEKQKPYEVQKDDKNRGKKREGGLRHTSHLSETHGPIMVPPSAARRGRGHGVRAGIDTGTRNVEGMVMTT